ncbi:hypothetical protein SDC9_206252 [bioreactor metagenome]|uniref:Uncharacterized protein n=1 Tax=bioreactor metagenome TaxID=1076179 RepID=A0A645J522_9ZZZZ
MAPFFELERHSELRVDRSAQNLAAASVYAGRNINRADKAAAAVYIVDRIRIDARYRTRKACPEYRVNNNVVYAFGLLIEFGFG